MSSTVHPVMGSNPTIGSCISRTVSSLKWACGIQQHLSPTRQRGPCLRRGLRCCRFTHTDFRPVVPQTTVGVRTRMLTWRLPLLYRRHGHASGAPAGPAPTDSKASQSGRALIAIAWLLLLLGLCWLLFFHRLGNRSTWSSHEARAAQDAQTILLDNAWGLPHLFDRKVELQTPPLYYWLVAGIAYLRGTPVDGWSVRLPAACAGLGGVLLVCLLGLGRRRPLAGFTAAAMLATASHYAWLARTGRIDMVLALLVGVNLVAFYLGQRRLREQEGRGAWSWFFLAYVAAALAALLKGPIGLLL